MVCQKSGIGVIKTLKVELLILAFLIGVAIPVVFADHGDAYLPWENDKPLNTTLEEICELLPYAPFYDCEKKWLLGYVDADYFLIPHTNSTVRGMAYWGYEFSRYVDIPKEDNEKYEALVIIGKQPIDNCYDYNCMPILGHEVKHVWCYCNWHEGMLSQYQLDKLNRGMFT